MTRLYTSRPTSSVPNQCAAVGPESRAFTSMCVGLPAMRGANAPIASVTAMMTAPTSVIFRRVSSTSQRGMRRSGSSAAGTRSVVTATGVSAIGVSLVLHPRIDHEVRQIDREIDEHVDAGDAQHDALDHRIVAP